MAFTSLGVSPVPPALLREVVGDHPGGRFAPINEGQVGYDLVGLRELASHMTEDSERVATGRLEDTH